MYFVYQLKILIFFIRALYIIKERERDFLINLFIFFESIWVESSPFKVGRRKTQDLYAPLCCLELKNVWTRIIKKHCLTVCITLSYNDALEPLLAAISSKKETSFSSIFLCPCHVELRYFRAKKLRCSLRMHSTYVGSGDAKQITRYLYDMLTAMIIKR